MPSTNWFRRNQKKFLGVLVVFLMVIWGIGPAIDYLVPKPPIGEIHGEKISQEEFNDTVIRWARVFFRGSREPIAEQVWKQMTLVNQAKRMGVFVTNDELAQGIQIWLTRFQVSPQIFTNREQYRRMLGDVFHITEYQFEKTIREYLLAEKLQNLLTNSIKVTKDEAFQKYMKENQKAKVKYAAFKAKDFVNYVETEEEEVVSFYDKYSGNFSNIKEGIWGYKEPEKVKIEYVMARYDEIEKQINITDEEMHEYYENKKDLMFKKEAEDTLESSEKSGEEKVDETSSPEYKSFDEVKEQIKDTLQLKKSETIINKLIGDVDNEIYENIDKEEFISLSKLAEKYGLSFVIPTNPNDGTNYFAKEELKEMVKGLKEFPQLVFDRELNDPSQPISSLEGKLIFQVLERIEPTTPSFEEIRDKVKKDLKYAKAFKKAESFAEKCLEKIDQTSFEEGITSIEEETGKIEIVETDYFGRPNVTGEDTPVNTLGPDRLNLAETAFSLKIGESAVTIEDKGEKACYVVMLVDKKEADPEKFEEEKDSIMAGYLVEKQSALLSKWESWVLEKSRLGTNKS